MRTGYSVGHLGIIREVGHLDLAEQTDTIATQQLGIDYTGILEHLLKEADTAKQTTLFALGSMILKVLAQVAFIACLTDCILASRQFYTLQMFQFVYELIEALL